MAANNSAYEINELITRKHSAERKVVLEKSYQLLENQEEIVLNEPMIAANQQEPISMEYDDGEEDAPLTQYNKPEQGESTFYEIVDQYRVKHSEELSQEDSAQLNEERMPLWLVEHIDEIKESLETELSDLHNPFELNEDADECQGFILENEIEQIRCAPEVREETREDLKSELIHPGSTITVGVSALLIMTVALRHSITGEALNDILTLISLHCIGSVNYIRSVSMLKKYFRKVSCPLTFHWYCTSCFMLLENKNNRICSNKYCCKDLSLKGNSSFFIEVPIAEQIQQMFSKPGFRDDIQYQHNRKRNKNVISDIYDGHVYQELSKEFRPGSNNVSLTWNTDGVPVFKSSRFSLWPLYFVINELPPKKRFAKENMILAGLWFGSSKPPMLTYLKPFHSSLSDLETNGVGIHEPTSSDACFNVRAILICGTCDLPAKACVCNSTQYNGFYGCSKCLQPGCTVKTGNRGGHVHAFPFDQVNVKGPPRTHKKLLADAKEAVEQGCAVNGIKGPCWFGGLHYYDLVKGTVIDYMHCVLEGVMKSLLNLWFNPSFKSDSFNISSQVKRVDALISQIKPPNDITRCPRNIETDRKYWKASELRSFLLFYGPALLLGILPEECYDHFILLSESIFILLGENISQAQIDHAENLLKHFCLMFSALYRSSSETINIHSLLHLADDVRNFGPLWTHSCFPFENFNGSILKLFHGSQNVELQIVSAVAITQTLPSLALQITPDSKEQNFYNRLVNRTATNESIIETDIYALGSSMDASLNQNQLLALERFLCISPLTSWIKKFTRVRIKGSIYHSASYQRVTARNSYTIAFQDMSNGGVHKIGQIQFFFQYQLPCSNTIACFKRCTCPTLNLVLVHVLHRVPGFAFVTDALTNSTALQMTAVSRPVDASLNIQVVPISSIIEKLVFMSFEEQSIAFVARFPNTIESD